MDIGLLLLRLAAGGIIAAHGAQKLFGSFGGPGIEGFGKMIEKMGLRPGKAYATVAGGSEFGGGILLVLGLLTPFGAAAVTGVMVGAIVLVHLDNGFFNTGGGLEFPLLLGTTALAVAFTGPGSFSLDAAMDLGLSGPAWGLAAAALATIGSLAMLASRSPKVSAEEEVTSERSAS